MENNARLQLLISKYLDRSLSGAEKDELLGYLDDPAFLNEIEERFGMEYDGEPGNESMTEISQQQLLQHVFEHDATEQSERIRKVRLWPRIGIAAAVATIIVSAGIWFYQGRQKDASVQVAVMNDVAPGQQGATLTLASGKKIKLTDALSGELAKEAGVSISKSADGKLVYEITGTDTDPNKINTLSTAKGETYEVRLPDGSLVALNAASSLSYPANFTALKERRVKLTGEGYFEIAKDKAHPFIVATDKQEVKVLGTHFNINSYSDEPSIKTTLLEGSVQINNQTILKPGEQATLSARGKVEVSEVDANKAIAWKNGKFIFDEENIESIMLKLSRWYNVEIIYQGDFSNRTFVGSISRTDNISKILSKITQTQAVHFKIEGRRITVMP